MIFKIILNIKFDAARKFIIYFLIFAFMITVSGCYTTDNYRLSGKELKEEDSEYDILRVVMKDGRTIDLNNTSARFVPEYMGKKNLIFYDDYDTMRIPVDSLSVYIDNKDAKNTLIPKFFAKASPLEPKPSNDSMIALPDTARNNNDIFSDSLNAGKPAHNDTLIYYPTVKIIELDNAKYVTVKKTEFDTWMTILTVAAVVTLLIVLYALFPPDDNDNSAKENDNKYYTDDYNRKEEEKVRKEQNNPSYCEVWNLSPPENSMNVPRNIILQWSYAHSDPDNLTFDVYVDNNNPPRIKAARSCTGKSYKLGLVAPGTKMYWQVVANYKGKRAAESPVWSFTTEN
jgi:hypothetical protein